MLRGRSSTDELILLGHGGGGRLSRQLIEAEILTRFCAQPAAATSDVRWPVAGSSTAGTAGGASGQPVPASAGTAPAGAGLSVELPDGALLPPIDGPLIFSTDAFVVQPLCFPGGSIGHLAVHGTVNDLAVMGARPLWLSLAMILEEGLPLATLRAVLDDVRAAAADCGVRVVTGDTKVVAAGQCDGLYLCSAGIGVALPGFSLGPGQARPGDRVLVSGTLGDHGMAVMACREGIAVGAPPLSDTGPVHRLVLAAQPYAAAVRFMRDPTRGGLAAVLGELTHGQPYGVELDEAALPFAPATAAVAEALGIDLLHVACEGRVLLICDPAAATPILAAWRDLPEGAGAAAIGTLGGEAGRVVLATGIGGRRLVDVPAGELLPRIC